MTGTFVYAISLYVNEKFMLREFNLTLDCKQLLMLPVRPLSLEIFTIHYIRGFKYFH